MCEFCALPMSEVCFTSPVVFTQLFATGLTWCIGHLRTLNELAKKANADYILHTGDFGFYDDSSLDRIADKSVTLHRLVSSTHHKSCK